ncbi:hypothetical protein O3597_17360 [Verrucosispora sp. WMMA2044]|uniref:hypothetical protein n=1 Tax=Verrucosispora sp. WMMA2044 TaxID=3016419 RepID=UPI00248CCE7D|nr:hypothetical protein [Verrucosispora sp. WMMA2044]WBB46938.1 hypothetical protein O3597_17360 [Verrucosispora sp. WMMA2044]
MPVDLDVPPGQVLLLLPGEWYPEPGRAAGRGVLVSVVAVSRQVAAGLVLTHAHDCDHRHPECGRHHCREAYVLVAANRACLAGAR